MVKGNGVLSTICAYISWGFLPVYWRFVDHVSPDKILTHRIIWSFFLMIGIVSLSKNWNTLHKTLQMIVKDKQQLIGVFFASVVISLNWLTYE